MGGSEEEQHARHGCRGKEASKRRQEQRAQRQADELADDPDVKRHVEERPDVRRVRGSQQSDGREEGGGEADADRHVEQRQRDAPPCLAEIVDAHRHRRGQAGDVDVRGERAQHVGRAPVAVTERQVGERLCPDQGGRDQKRLEDDQVAERGAEGLRLGLVPLPSREPGSHPARDRAAEVLEEHDQAGGRLEQPDGCGSDERADEERRCLDGHRERGIDQEQRAGVARQAPACVPEPVRAP